MQWVTALWRRGRLRRYRRITSRNASFGAKGGAAHGAALRRRPPSIGSGPRCDARCRGFSAACVLTRAPSLLLASFACTLRCRPSALRRGGKLDCILCTQNWRCIRIQRPRSIRSSDVDYDVHFFVIFFFRIYNVIMYIIEFILRLRFVII